MIGAMTVDPLSGGVVRDAVWTPPNMAGGGNQREVSGHGKLVPGGGANPDILLVGAATGLLVFYSPRVMDNSCPLAY